MMVYEIEFMYAGNEYEYEINARDGSVTEFNREREKTPPRAAESQAAPSPPPTGFIQEDRVAEIIKNHAGIDIPVKMRMEMEKDDGLYISEVEFKSGGYEYSYEIDASTGDIISWESEEDEDD
jgi:uncharacterized membrane protein YkoI